MEEEPLDKLHFQIQEASGLSLDYPHNAWASHLYIIVCYGFGEIKSREELLQKLESTQIKHYKDYFEGKYPNHADKIMKEAKREFLSLVDETVNEYNALSPEDKSNKDMQNSYINKAQRIISGTLEPE